MYKPQIGDHIRVTRQVNGKTRFTKTGVIVETCHPHGYRFREDETGAMRFLAESEQVARTPGWSQTITRLP